MPFVLCCAVQLTACNRIQLFCDNQKNSPISGSISESNYSVSVGGYADPDPEPPEPDRPERSIKLKHVVEINGYFACSKWRTKVK